MAHREPRHPAGPDEPDDWSMRPLRWLGRLALVAWVAGSLGLGAALLSLHARAPTRPTPGAPGDPSSEDPRLAQLAGRGASTWRMVHVVHADCACSTRLLEHLLVRGRLPDVDERVLLLGSSPRDRRDLERVGFVVEEVTADLAARQYGVDRAPLLVIADPRRAVRYAGGYAERADGAPLLELTLLARARGERIIGALPGLGCSVSARAAALGLPSERRDPPDRS